jgi:hypothetical protein
MLLAKLYHPLMQKDILDINIVELHYMRASNRGYAHVLELRNYKAVRNEIIS